MHTAGPSIWRGLTSAHAEVFRKYSWRGQHSLVSVEHKAQQCGSLASAQVAQGLACTANSTVGFGSEGLWQVLVSTSQSDTGCTAQRKGHNMLSWARM